MAFEIIKKQKYIKNSNVKKKIIWNVFSSSQFINYKLKKTKKKKLSNEKKLKFVFSKRKKKDKDLSCCVRINFVSNNIFCTFWSISNKKTIRVYSAGMSKIKISKKRLSFYSRSIIKSFLRIIKKWRLKYRNKFSLFFFSLRVPKKLRYYILKAISWRATAINFEYSKAFNGCKAKKKRRKKRLRFRNFK